MDTKDIDDKENPTRRLNQRLSNSNGWFRNDEEFSIH